MTDSTKTDLKQVTASRRQAMDPALSEDLLERVLTPENLRKAWSQVRANHGAPGVDGMTIAAAADAFEYSRWRGTAIGAVTSAVHSPRLKKNIGYAWLPVEKSELGQTVTVLTEWGTRTATVVEKPFVDPKKLIPVS